MTQKQKDNLASVINAAIERYPLEDIADVFIDQITDYKERRKVANSLMNNSLFMDEFLGELWGKKLDWDQEERLISAAEQYGTFIKITSLVQQIRVDEFLEDLKANPYQLKLIA